MHNDNNDNAAQKVRADIPLLQKTGAHYLDNAATALMPQVVIRAVADYDSIARANIGRGLYKFAETADEYYATARRVCAQLLKAADDEIVFTSGSSAGLNLLAMALGQTLSANDAVVLSVAEHHSNIVPWQLAAKRYGFALRFANITADGRIDKDDIRRHSIDGRARIFALTHASNVSGAINDITTLSQIAKYHNDDALVITDGAQYIPHSFIDLPQSGADFYVFSGHKCGAPTGIGVLWGRALCKLPAVIGGGGAVLAVREDGYDMAELPRRLEVGTPPISQAIGLAAAMRWLNQLPKAARQNQKDLAQTLRRELQKIKGVRVLFADNNAPMVAFNIDGVHPHDVCQILANHNVAVRGGSLCAEPLMRKLNINGCIRASIAPYNNAADITALLNAVRETIKQLATL